MIGDDVSKGGNNCKNERGDSFDVTKGERQKIRPLLFPTMDNGKKSRFLRVRQSVENLGGKRLLPDAVTT